MSRIIAGSAGGRRIAMPAGAGTRPTSDRVREAIFARLEHLDAVADAVVLDLFAGSGALGLEAASRGARSVTLVEHDRKAAEVIRANIRNLGMNQVTVRAEKVSTFLARPAHDAAHLVFLDPPYDLGADTLNQLLATLVEDSWLRQDAVLVVERSSRSPEPVWPADVELLGPRTYGETIVWIAEYVPEGESA